MGESDTLQPMSYYIELGRKLWDAAEGGFKEWKTQEILAQVFEDAGFILRFFDTIPGFIADWPSTEEREKDASSFEPQVALITDMDALPLKGGGYRHMCGHHQQMTVLAATALEIKKKAPELLNKISFIAFPAEEYVELEERRRLKEKGTISRLSGKQEILEKGLLNNYKAVVAMHSEPLSGGPAVKSVKRMNGFDELRLEFTGESAHAGAAPFNGRNAQNAGSLFLQAAAFLRERFNEENHVRIHPVLRLPPDQPVNFIPDTAVVESYVRAATVEAVQQTMEEMEAAARGCAQALGVEIKVDISPGYLPVCTNPTLHQLANETADEMGIGFEESDFGAASSDVGDISQKIPSIIIGLPGTNGRFHHPDFRVVDEDLAFQFPPDFIRRYLAKILSNLSLLVDSH